LYIGKKHDFSILKEEFEPDINWFKNLKVRLDLGYTGFENYYNAKEVIIPKKKPKNKELNQSDIDDNKLKAKKRIKVEHCISGIKRYRILSIKNRIHDLNLYDDVLEVCAGLWNFYLTY
jgi:hypothetical protein